MIGRLGRFRGRINWLNLKDNLNPDQLPLSTLGRVYVIRSSIYTLKGFCLVSCFDEYVFEVRPSTGPSMLPTLNTALDTMLNIRLGLNRLLHMNWQDIFKRTSFTRTPLVKGDASMGTGLAVGDIVTVVSPHKPELEACKRVLGLPGDTILFDTRLDPPVSHDLEWNQKDIKSRKEGSPPDPTKDPVYVVVPKGHIWIGGDNMANSTDSRHYGPVPMGLVRGKVLATVYPSFTWQSNNLRPAPQ